MAGMKKMPKMDGPIPGENYLQDTRNFPWHRPADETDFVGIVNKAIKQMSRPEVIGQMLTALESGDTILDYVSGTARITVGSGKVPIDQAVLAAGPIARFVESVAVRAGINFERGWDEHDRVLTPEYVKAHRPGRAAPAAEPEVEETAEPEGFMGMPDQAGPASSATQQQMLG